MYLFDHYLCEFTFTFHVLLGSSCKKATQTKYITFFHSKIMQFLLVSFWKLIYLIGMFVRKNLFTSN
jgi:hypothetical protein